MTKHQNPVATQTAAEGTTIERKLKAKELNREIGQMLAGLRAMEFDDRIAAITRALARGAQLKAAGQRDAFYDQFEVLKGAVERGGFITELVSAKRMLETEALRAKIGRR